MKFIIFVFTLRHMLKQRFLAITALLVSMLYLAGSTCVNFSVHTCSGSQKTDVTLFPEFQKESAGCCCQGFTSQLPAPVKSTISDPGCCKTTFRSFKANLNSFNVTVKTVANPSLQVISELPVRNCPTMERQCLAEYLPWLDHSPPLSGKSLIYFLHQIRIPYPVC